MTILMRDLAGLLTIAIFFVAIGLWSGVLTGGL